MNFLELAQTRYSVRSFSPQPVEQEKVDLLLRAAQAAPTAVNFQPYRILVLQEQEALTKLKDCTRYHFDAPLALVVLADHAVSWKRKYDGKDAAEVDAAIIGTHIMLQAVDLGLGSTWVGYFDPSALREAYHVPEKLEPIAIFPIGYPAEGCSPSAQHTQRKPLEEIAVYNGFQL